MNGDQTSQELTALAGGPVPPPPSIPQAVFGARRQVASAGPGTVPRPANVAKAPKRDLGGLGVPSQQEMVNLQRLEKLRKAIGELAAKADATTAQINALVKEVTGSAGGQDLADRHGVNLEAAAALATDLSDVLDKHFPPVEPAQ